MNWTFWLGIYAATILGAISMAVSWIVITRNVGSHAGRFGWMLFSVIAPVLGLLAYLLFGNRKIQSEYADRSLPSIDHLRQHEVDDRELNTISALAYHRGAFKPLKGNSVRCLFSPEEMYEATFDAIEAAEKTIYVATFILDTGKTGKRLVERLAAKAAQGVCVRLMVDGAGSFAISDEFLQPIEDAGGKVAWFKPLSHLSRFPYLDLRNHRKILVVDGGTAVTGGANFATLYMTDTPDESTWCDLCLKLRGPAAAAIEALFQSDWRFVTDEQLPLLGGGQSYAGDSAVQVVPGGADSPTDLLHDLMIHSIGQSQKRLWLVTPYFIPPPVTQHLLIVAARRGVDVRVIVPLDSDLKMVDAARFAFLANLCEVGARVYRYPRCMLHAKAMVVDDEAAIVGSANFDMRSMFLNYELLSVLQSPSEIAAIAKWIQTLCDDSYEGGDSPTLLRHCASVAAQLIATEL